MKLTGTEKLAPLIHDVARLLRRRFESRTGDHGLSAAQWRALVHVAKTEGLPQARLADLLEIEPISVSRLLDRMEEAGWVERRPDPSDRRVRSVYPTDRSRALYDELRHVAVGVYEEALAGLSLSERAALIAALETISANLSDGSSSLCTAAEAEETA